jgi:hypothetical protein
MAIALADLAIAALKVGLSVVPPGGLPTDSLRVRCNAARGAQTDSAAAPTPAGRLGPAVSGGQEPFVYQTSPQQYREEPSASPQITWATPVELTAIPK